MDQRVPSLWATTGIDLADGQQQSEARLHRQEVAQITRLPLRGLDAVEDARDRAHLRDLRDDLVDRRTAHEVEVAAGHAAAREALRERRPQPFLRGGVEHRAALRVEEARGERALTRPRLPDEHRERAVPNEDLVEPRQGLGLASELRECRSVRDLDELVEVSAGALTEHDNAPARTAPAAPQDAHAVARAAVHAGPRRTHASYARMHREVASIAGVSIAMFAARAPYAPCASISLRPWEMKRWTLDARCA